MQQYGRERQKNLTRDRKSKVVGYRKKYYKMRKDVLYNYKKVF